eukprot:m.567339 g.567339  ORF g.567339 m.567339 type:complete len:115 (+) comp57836_c0_seq10:2624-2968(+)
MMGEAAVDLFESLLDVNPTTRISVANALAHRFLQVDSATIPPISLPASQDCHEMFFKNQRHRRPQPQPLVVAVATVSANTPPKAPPQPPKLPMPETYRNLITQLLGDSHSVAPS